MYQRFIFPLLRKFDAENIHSIVLYFLYLSGKSPFLLGQVKKRLAINNDRLSIEAFGLHFKNPVGIAAGFDKNAVVVPMLGALGFGFIEVGTITPDPQIGKEKPRIFRLFEDKALINRMGFPNKGLSEISNNLAMLKKRSYVLGINFGPNLKSVEKGKATADYLKCFTELESLGDYMSINISSPNTQGLRLLHAKNSLNTLLCSLFDAKKTIKSKKPLLIKISPDLSSKELSELLAVCLHFPLAGIIATNTTIIRPSFLKSTNQHEAGGLSGAPLKKLSTEIIKSCYRQTKGKLPIIAVGGIFTADDAIEKIEAGATLVQIYTGFIYEGPILAQKINSGILAYLEKNKMKSIKELIGRKNKL